MIYAVVGMAFSRVVDLIPVRFLYRLSSGVGVHKRNMIVTREESFFITE